jgi:hypothetical protein
MKVDEFVEYWGNQLRIADDFGAAAFMPHQSVRRAIAIIELQREALKYTAFLTPGPTMKSHVEIAREALDMEV